MTTVIRDVSAALGAVRHFGIGHARLARSSAHLSTGLRVIRAADDAAALEISTGMRTRLRGLAQSVRNLQDGIGMLNVGDGALNEALATTQRMRELTIQARSSLLSQDQRRALGAELLELRRSLDNTLDNARFNDTYVFRGLAVAGADDEGTVTQGGGTLTVGTVMIPGDDGPGVSVSAINVSLADPGETYTFTASGANLALTSSGGDSQSVSLSKMTGAGDTPQVLNFNLLGVIVTLEGYEGPPAVKGTSTAIASAFDGHTITTTLTGGGGGGGTVSGSSEFVINPGAHGLVSIAFNRTQTATLGSGENFFLSQLIADPHAVETMEEASTLLASLDTALQQLADERGRIGGQTNKVQSYIDYQLSESENLAASLSRIADADIAAQSVTHVRTSTMQDLRATVTREAVRLSESALSLIRSGDLF